MTHTPGPWVVKGQKSIRGPNGEYIAKANWQNGMANAKLAATAPELLIALKDAIKFANAANLLIAGQVLPASAEWLAIVAKAEGRT